jgi:hypothetical protein
LAHLTYSQALQIAKVFGEPTKEKTIVLWLFREPAIPYLARERIKTLPKKDRVADATIYRQVKKLSREYFLDATKKRTMILKEPADVSEYQLSFPKGVIALTILAYVLYLSPDASTDLKKKLGLADFAEIVNSPFWRPFLFFLQWHRDTGIDLSHARIEPLYYNFTFMLAMLNRLEEISENEFNALSQFMETLGLGPQHGRSMTIQELRNLKTKAQENQERMQELMKSLTASDAKKWRRELKAIQDFGGVG